MVIDENNYKIEIKDVGNLAGFATGVARGNHVNVMNNAFLTSFDHFHSKIMKNAISTFVGQENGVNNLLVVIRSEKASIYRKFPVILLIRPKTEIKKFHAVFKHQILDIEGVQFKDMLFDLDIQDGDKFLWLFRSNFNFGMYFDYSGKLKVEELSSILGRCYRSLEYYEICTYFQDSSNCEPLFNKGWFPFVQLIGDNLESLISSPTDDIDLVGNLIVNSFTQDKIEDFTKYWWENKVFANKKKLINAGLTAFYSNTEEGNINCIKNLVSEIEGVIKISYHLEYNKKPSTETLKKYLIEKAQHRFPSDDSFGFTGLFAEYLNDVIFKGFDIEKGSTNFSRNLVNHGVADDIHFTRARALQCILTLDQIYFYLGRTET